MPQPNHDDLMLAWSIANQRRRPQGRPEIALAAQQYAEAPDPNGEQLDPLVAAALDAHMTRRNQKYEEAVRRRREQEAFEREKAARDEAFEREVSARRDLANEERGWRKDDRAAERQERASERADERRYTEDRAAKARAQEETDYDRQRGDRWSESMKEQAVRYFEKHGDYGPFAGVPGLPELKPRPSAVGAHHLQAIGDVVKHPSAQPGGKPLTTLDEIQAAGGTPADAQASDARRDAIIKAMLAEGVSPQQVGEAVGQAYGMGDNPDARRQALQWAQRAAEILSQAN